MCVIVLSAIFCRLNDLVVFTFVFAEDVKSQVPQEMHYIFLFLHALVGLCGTLLYEAGRAWMREMRVVPAAPPHTSGTCYRRNAHLCTFHWLVKFKLVSDSVVFYVCGLRADSPSVALFCAFTYFSLHLVR